MEQLDACTHISPGKNLQAPFPGNGHFRGHSNRHHFDALNTGHSPAL